MIYDWLEKNREATTNSETIQTRNILNDIKNSALPSELIDKILFYSNPRMSDNIQSKIKNFQFESRAHKFVFTTINTNILRIYGGMGGFAVM